MENSEKLGAKKDNPNVEQENLGNKTNNFFKKYQNVIYGVVIGIIVLIGLIWALKRFYIQPQNEKASAAMVQPIEYFMRGDSASLVIALEGNDEIDGFLTIASDYGITRTANTANYYAGLSYLKLGDKESALEYLQKFSKKENILWYHAQSVIGDIYLEMQDEAKALDYYKKAVKSEDPYFAPIDLFKLAQYYEIQNDWDKAYDTYKTIESDYYDQYVQMGVDKFLERAKINAGK